MTRAAEVDLVARDRACVWHPFTQHATDEAPLPVAAARDAVLVLEDGSEVVDAISSWWSCLHGHCRPEIVEAIAGQAGTLDHTLFAGTTHEPAVALAERLVALAPDGLERVFFSDDGSTAVEVALKLVVHGWRQRGEPARRVFVAFEGSYHGDTFGAMSVGDPDPFFAPYADLLFEVARAPLDAGGLEEALDRLGERAAGVIIEPLVQGAGGMRMHSPGLVGAVRHACDRRGLPLVADEVMTGFGRTGTLFACQRAGVVPDLMCLSKGLTGGTLPLAATLTTGAVFEDFLSPDRRRLFPHGHTFTANPIGCAAALASLRLVVQEDAPGRLDTVGRRIEAALAPALAGHPRVRDLRRRGGIVALDLVAGEDGYWADLGPRLRHAAVERGVLLRPLGNVLYAMPPACTTGDQCERIARVMADLADLVP